VISSRADADNEPDLFWALRGGGGNFGVVTEIEIGLSDVQTAYAGMLIWPAEQAGEVLKTWGGLDEGGADQAAVGGDDLDGVDVVGPEAVLARHPAQAAPEQVAGNADVVRGARQRSARARRPTR
jgi:hypothetical protein